MEKTKIAPFGRTMFAGHFTKDYEVYYSTTMSGADAYSETYKSLYKPEKTYRLIRRIPISKLHLSILKEGISQIYAEHPNVIRCLEWYYDESYVYLVHEYLFGGTLRDRIYKHGKLEEKAIALIFKQIFGVLKYFAASGLHHGSLSSEDIIFQSNDPLNLTIKVASLHLRSLILKAMKPEEKKGAGKLFYKAPEQFSKGSSPLTDIWAVGVMIYETIAKKLPFASSNSITLEKMILSYSYALDVDTWKDFGDCRKLVKQILVPSSKRINAAEALNDPWIVKHVQENAARVTIGPVILKCLMDFRDGNEFKRSILSYMATQLADSDLEAIKRSFMRLDQDSDGKLTKEELAVGLKPAIVGAELDALFSKIDTDNNGYITYNEFLAATIPKDIKTDRKRLMKAFKIFDKDEDGTISAKELKAKFLSVGCIVEDSFWTSMIAMLDKNKDGSVQIDEFFDMMISPSPPPLSSDKK